MQEKDFVEKFRASLGDKAEVFIETLEKVFSEEIEVVNAPKVKKKKKVKIDKEDYEIMAVSWKEQGASEEREQLRYILKQALRIAENYENKNFVDGINFVLQELDDRDASQEKKKID